MIRASRTQPRYTDEIAGVTGVKLIGAGREALVQMHHGVSHGPQIGQANTVE
jgi:hypothetical protein